MCHTMPASVITIDFRGLPHLALTLSALSSLRNDASLLNDMTLSLYGLKVGTAVIAEMVSNPSTTLPKTMFSPSNDIAGAGPAQYTYSAVDICGLLLVAYETCVVISCIIDSQDFYLKFVKQQLQEVTI